MIILTNKYKPKLSYNELKQTKASTLMKTYNMSERDIQREISKHCGNESQKVQHNVYKEIYCKKEE